MVSPPDRQEEDELLRGREPPFRGRIIQMTTGEAKAPAFTKFLGRVIREYPKEGIWVSWIACRCTNQGGGRASSKTIPG
ncbi:MAG: hypothetical protein QXR19_04805 [Candidatus Jordarchaeaceae archaeon]